MHLAKTCAATIVALGLSLPTIAAEGLKISDARARATPDGATTGIVYLTVTNEGAVADRLIGGASDAAERVEIHQMKMTDGVMTMRPIPGGLEIPAHGEVKLQPNGDHVMLIGLKHPLKAGENVAITLDFEKGGKIPVAAKIFDPKTGQ